MSYFHGKQNYDCFNAHLYYFCTEMVTRFNSLSCGIVLKKYTKGFEVQQLTYTKLQYNPPILDSYAKILLKPTKHFPSEILWLLLS